jgi:hypothetical protein
MANRIPLTRVEIVEQLADQEMFLASDCSAFDEQSQSYARKISVTLRVLLHDTQNSASVLALLGYKFAWQWLDTAGPLNPRNMMSENALVRQRMTMTEVGPVSSYEPVLDDIAPFDLERRRWRTFENWWTDPVVKDGDNTFFSRQDLVLALANRDGGGHVFDGVEHRDRGRSDPIR